MSYNEVILINNKYGTKLQSTNYSPSTQMCHRSRHVSVWKSRSMWCDRFLDSVLLWSSILSPWLPSNIVLTMVRLKALSGLGRGDCFPDSATFRSRLLTSLATNSGELEFDDWSIMSLTFWIAWSWPFFIFCFPNASWRIFLMSRTASLVSWDQRSGVSDQPRFPSQGFTPRAWTPCLFRTETSAPRLHNNWTRRTWTLREAWWRAVFPFISKYKNEFLIFETAFWTKYCI